MDFKYKFTELRRGHGLTREELAIKLNMPINIIIDLEKGNTIPDSSQIKKISKLFEVSKKILINDNLDIEDTLDELYSNQFKTISYREKENVETLNKKQTIMVYIVIFGVLLTFIIMIVRFQMILNIAWNC